MKSEFVRTHTHADGLDTEQNAAEKAEHTAAQVKAAILMVLKDAGPDGLNHEEIATRVGTCLRGQQVDFRARRIYDLRKEGKVRHHPDGRKTLNEAGNPCICWVLGDDPKKGRKKSPPAALVRCVRAWQIQWVMEPRSTWPPDLRKAVEYLEGEE